MTLRATCLPNHSDASSAGREDDANSSDESKKLCDAFDGSQLSFIEECTEDLEMEYEFTESRDSLTDLPSSHTYRKELPLKVSSQSGP